MSIRVIAGITVAAISLLSATNADCKTVVTSNKSTTKHSAKPAKVQLASASTYHKWQHKTHGRRGAYLVPPPPAYMPCVLPELYYHSSGTGITEVAVAAKKPENPYKKYIQTPAGDAPEPIQTRKGVVTWSNRS